jgi:uncharacterized iron-regulated membrane protein
MATSCRCDHLTPRPAWKPGRAPWQRRAGGNVPGARWNIAERPALARGLRPRRLHRGSSMLASRNLLVALVLVLVAVLAVVGYSLYQEKKKPDGVEISVGKNGLSIKEK